MLTDAHIPDCGTGLGISTVGCLFTSESPIVFGAGAFNTQYNSDPEIKDATQVIKHAFASGITTIDTAAFYGPSEVILGEALSELATQGWQRESYQLCSKCCRWETDEVDYSADTVRKSVERSLTRLRTNYLDMLYIHDVEFGSPPDVLHALMGAFELKREGKIRGVGISGYPLPVLLTVAKMAQRHGTPLDGILSYCNLTLQNDLLLKYKPLFEKAGVKVVLNASPLCMSLLRSRPTHGFHMAQQGMKQTADKIGRELLKNGEELADAATQYAFAQWSGPTVIGLRSVKEIDSVVHNRELGLKSPKNQLWNRIIEDFGEWHNATWSEDRAIAKQALWDTEAEKFTA